MENKAELQNCYSELSALIKNMGSEARRIHAMATSTDVNTNQIREIFEQVAYQCDSIIANGAQAGNLLAKTHALAIEERRKEERR